MAMDTSDPSTQHLPLESIPVIDLRLLSQSDLTSLSLCSQKSFDLTRCDDVVIPKIDRSVFNESAGSRKQTYSRLRLAPQKPESVVARGRRSSALLPVDNDPETKDNKRIISLLRGLLGYNEEQEDNHHNQELVVHENPQPPPPPPPPPLYNGVVHRGESMKKRGRKRKIVVDKTPETLPSNVSGHEIVTMTTDIRAGAGQTSVGYDTVKEMEIVNKNGVVVDMDTLANGDDPFGPELRRRTVGLNTEEELLGFLRGLEGLWGSRRKKRKIVNASEFGDFLPIDWKLLLSLKRREGYFWLICRRYISPYGQQFASCKEVASYLRSVFGSEGDIQADSRHDAESDPEVYELESESTAGPTYKDESTSDELIYCPTSPVASLTSEHERQATLLGTDNLAEVEIRDLLECHICKQSFTEKDVYLQHLLSSHQRNAKKCRLGTSICDGVIIKDGQYECQFCHKVFHERHRYNGHVGVHVRNYVRSLEQSPDTTTMQKNIEASSTIGVPLEISAEDVSVNIDKESVPITSTAVASGDLNVDSPLGKMDAGSYVEMSTVNSSHNLNSPDSQHDTRASVPQFCTVEPKNGNVNSPRSLGLGSIPEESSAKSTYALNVEFVNSEQETGANRVDEISGEQETGADTVDEILGDWETCVNSERETVASRVDEILGEQETGLNKVDEILGEQETGLNKVDEILGEQETGLNKVDEILGEQETGLNKVDEILGEQETGLNKVDEVLGEQERSVNKVDELFSEQKSCAIRANEILGEQETCVNSEEDKVDDISGDRSHEKLSNGYETNGGIRLSSVPEESTSKPDCDLNVVSVGIAQETGPSKLDKILGDTSSAKQDHGYDFADDEMVKADDTDSNLDADLSSCLDSATLLCRSEKHATYGGKDIPSTTVEIDKPYNEQEVGSLSFSPSPSVSERTTDVENRTNDFSFTLKDSTLAESIDFGTNEPGNGFEIKESDIDKDALKETFGSADRENMLHRVTTEQEVGSLSFLPSLSVSERITNAETRTYDISFGTLKKSKIAESIDFGSNEPRNGFESKGNGSDNAALPEPVASADRKNMLHWATADTSPPFVQSSDYFPTLNLMPDKDIGDSILQTYTLESNNGNVDSPRGILRLNSIPEESTAKSNYLLNFGSVENKQETNTGRFDDIFGGRSHGKQDNLDADLSSCLNSASFLCRNEKYDTFGRKDLSDSTIDTAKPYLQQEVGCFSFSPAPSFSDKISDAETRRNEFSFFNLKDSDEVAESGNYKPRSGFGSKEAVSGKNSFTGPIRSDDEDNILQRMMVETSPPFVQSSNCFTAINMASGKGVSDMDSLNQKLEDVPGFDELRLGLGDVDSSKFPFVTGMESNSLPQEPMDFAYGAVLEPGLDTPGQFAWESILPHMHRSQQVTTVCVWCGGGFNHEIANSSMQPDSVCPTCKAKIQSNSMFWNMGCQ